MSSTNTRPEPESPATIRSVSDKISSIVLTEGPPRGWYIGAAVSLVLTLMMLTSITWLFVRGTGVWGLNIPVAWGLAIINFVWWIGIGETGTFISAFLLLFRQEWRSSINRFAEAMTLFAVVCAGLFPLLHLGRPWFFYWLLPYPATTGVWPQFRSPLVWDCFAVSAYAMVSMLFWYVGLIPDLATLRDRAENWFSRILYGMLALGWRGSVRHWKRYQMAYLLLAGLVTPLVISVHSIVSLDFAVGQVPGWHETIFPPYFVAGALYSGFSMVLTIAIPLRSAYGLKEFITERHFDNMGKVMLATGLVVSYGYMMEHFTGWYGGNLFEKSMFQDRETGPYAFVFWGVMCCNVLIPQLLWWKPFRTNPLLLFSIATVVNVGMWLERFLIVSVSLHHEFLPSASGMYVPTFWDWSLLVGSLGLFALLLFLFIRLLPMISIFEMRELVHEEEDS